MIRRPRLSALWASRPSEAPRTRFVLQVEPRRYTAPFAAVAMPLVIAMSLAACSTPAEYADWTLPLPEGARIVEHVVTPLAARDVPAVVLEEDLVLGNGRGDPALTFYGMPYFAVGEDGRVYAMDMGNHRVLVFGADGEHIMTLGRQGQGPGEFHFGAVGSIAVYSRPRPGR